jgi:ribosomal-protein-alanine N-acetyltransferase
MPEAVVVLLQYAFESLKLHRIESTSFLATPHHGASSRNSAFASKGIAERYLEIDGAWEDHARYAITAEEWNDRAPELVTDWLIPQHH